MKITIDLKMDRRWFVIMLGILIVIILLFIHFGKNNVTFIEVDQYTNCSCPDPFPTWSRYLDAYEPIDASGKPYICETITCRDPCAKRICQECCDESESDPKDIWIKPMELRCCYPTECGIPCEHENPNCIYPVACYPEKEIYWTEEDQEKWEERFKTWNVNYTDRKGFPWDREVWIQNNS
jgi:hypothetical protein